MNPTVKVLSASSLVAMRQRLFKASSFAFNDRMLQRINAFDVVLPNRATTRLGRLRMSSVVVTQSKAGEGVVSVPKSSSPSPFSPASSTSSELLIVTPSCFQRIQFLLQQRNKSPDSMYLRVFVDAGGCSGFQYQFDLVEDAKEAVDPEQDVVMSSDAGMRVVADQTSLEYMKGATVDYVQQMIKSAFSVTNNPQSESACGCGSSFAVKNFEANPAAD